MSTTDFSWARVSGHGALEKSALNTDASNNFTPGQMVKLDTANVISGTPYLTGPGVVLGTAAVFPYGVVLTNANSVAGVSPYNPVRVQFGGEVQVNASAAISAGNILATAASGKVATQTSAQPQVGQAMTAAASSTDLLQAALHFANNA
jgi:hypothetical protein